MFRDISDVYLHDETQKNNNDMKSIYDKTAFSHNISCIIFAFWCGFQTNMIMHFIMKRIKAMSCFQAYKQITENSLSDVIRSIFIDIIYFFLKFKDQLVFLNWKLIDGSYKIIFI